MMVSDSSDPTCCKFFQCYNKPNRIILQKTKLHMFHARCKELHEHIFHYKYFPQVGSSYTCMQYQRETVLWDLNVSVKTWFVVHGPKAIIQSRQEVKFYQPLMWRPQASPGKRKSHITNDQWSMLLTRSSYTLPSAELIKWCENIK